ncbi:MAG: hypothetical protein IJY12_05400 [Clostridia bacterium]|nr:hypothetical protein [Clostridia bacterium]
MSLSFHYIAEGKAYCFRDGKATELDSKVLKSYVDRVKTSARRTEWKYSGSGAEFTGTYRAGADAESRVASIFSRVHCLRTWEDEVLYSLTIDRTSGIYRKTEDNAASDGIVISDAENAYHDFDIRNGRIVLSAAFAGESHIGIMRLGENICDMYTEGHSWDSAPVWSAVSPDRIYFCCAGLPIEEAPEPTADHPKSYSDMVNEMYSSATVAPRGASAICLLDLVAGTIDEVLSNGKYDYLHPQSTPDGSLYYIRRPYRASSGGSGALGCLGDIFLLPVRLIGALFGFLNVFSAKYSGKTLSKNTDVKNRDERQMLIDGNLIHAEEELKANKRHGDKNPGIIPRSWELRRIAPDGSDTLIRAGVAAFRVDEEDGSILVSNGSHILRLTTDGGEEKLHSATGVTAIC